MLKTLRHKVDKAYIKLSEADCAVQEVYTLLKFKDFEDYDLPGISYAHGGHEIFLEYNGYEIDIKEVITLMEKNGVITPQDFNMFLD